MVIKWCRQYKKFAVNLVREFKVELILGLLVAVLGTSYMLLSNRNIIREIELRRESVNTYPVKVDIGVDSDDLINTMYDSDYTVSRDIYFKYQMKNVGETLSYYETADSVAQNRINGRVNIAVTAVERLDECPLIKKVKGGTYIRLTVHMENLMDDDCLICMNYLRCILVDDNGCEVIDEAYKWDGFRECLSLEECGDRLDCYFLSFGNGNGQFVPVGLNEARIQYILFKKGESKTFNLVYGIPEEVADDSRLSLSNAATVTDNVYNNKGFSIYLNRQSEE